MATESPRPPLPPFTEETARQKVAMAEAAWNSKDPDRVALAYTPDSEWRNRGEFVKGRDAIKDFLRRKWARELGYVLRKYYWAHSDNRIAVCFEYEYHDEAGQWYRAYGNENWEFDNQGYMRKRIASINDVRINSRERRIALDAGEAPSNTWLGAQGLTSTADVFPMSGGSTPAY